MERRYIESLDGGNPSPIRILTDQEVTLFPIHGGVGVSPVGVSCPPPPPPPAGEPHLITPSSPGVTASLWVSGALLRFRSGDGSEYGETGASQPTPPAPTAIARSVWKDGPSDNIRYVDDSGVHRQISATSLGAKPSPSQPGSIYYEAGESNARLRIRWIGASNFYKWHNGF